jgi:hypothetical protein
MRRDESPTMSSDGMNAAAALWAEGFLREREGGGEWGGGVCVRVRVRVRVCVIEDAR